MEAVGAYKAVVVRPRPTGNGGGEGADFEILDGHARVDALRAMSRESVRCDVWELNDRQARLFLAARDGVKGETVPELRLDLLLTLLNETDVAELADLVSETEPYLRQLMRLRDSVAREALDDVPALASRTAYDKAGAPPEFDPDDDFSQAGRIPMTLMLTRTQYAAVDRAPRNCMTSHRFNDAGDALEHLLHDHATRPA